MRSRLLFLFAAIMKKVKPNSECTNLNNFDIPFNVVVGKMLNFMGNLNEGEKKQ